MTSYGLFLRSECGTDQGFSCSSRRTDFPQVEAEEGGGGSKKKTTMVSDQSIHEEEEVYRAGCLEGGEEEQGGEVGEEKGCRQEEEQMKIDEVIESQGGFPGKDVRTDETERRVSPHRTDEGESGGGEEGHPRPDKDVPEEKQGKEGREQGSSVQGGELEDEEKKQKMKKAQGMGVGVIENVRQEREGEKGEGAKGLHQQGKEGEGGFLIGEAKEDNSLVDMDETSTTSGWSPPSPCRSEDASSSYSSLPFCRMCCKPVAVIRDGDASVSSETASWKAPAYTLSLDTLKACLPPSSSGEGEEESMTSATVGSTPGIDFEGIGEDGSRSSEKKMRDDGERTRKIDSGGSSRMRRSIEVHWGLRCKLCERVFHATCITPPHHRRITPG